MNIKQLRKEMVIRMLSGIEQRRAWLETADDCLSIPIGGYIKAYVHTNKGTRMERRLRLLGDCVEEKL